MRSIRKTVAAIALIGLAAVPAGAQNTSDVASDPLDPESIPLGLMHWPEDEPLPRIGDVDSDVETPVVEEERSQPWIPIALIVSALAVVGVWVLVRRSNQPD